ncbi:MAG TPA: hypothetical protein VHV78_15840 [Gemmatimonadaceae bacterium]|jgi:hypothetical protein|nr:hypothetical protein [Gemmatimonadaceae bacterium]
MMIHRAPAWCGTLAAVLCAAAVSAMRLEAQGNVSHPQFDAAMPVLTASPMSEGSFAAIASPWTAVDGGHRVELAHFSGSAAAIKSGVSYTVSLCENGHEQALLGSVVFAQRSDAQASSNPSFHLPEDRITVALSGDKMTLDGAPTGTVQISLFGQSVSGVAKLRYASGKVPGSAAEPVDVAISFRAPLQEGRGVKRACSAGRARRP